MAITRINNNLAAINANRNLGITSSDLSRSLERLSSGLRINRASDDAAGLTISENLRSQINGLNRAVQNASDAISLVNTAEGALNETTARLQRIRVLAVQAANTGTNDSVALQALQDEIETSIAEITRIGNDTQFATRRLLNGENSNSARITDGSVGVSVATEPNASTLSSGLHFFRVTQTNAGSETLANGTDGVNNSGATNLTGSTFASGTYDLTISNVRAAATRVVAVDTAITSGGSVPAGGDSLTTATFTTGSTTYSVDQDDVLTLSGVGANGTSYSISYTLGATFDMDTVAAAFQTGVRADTGGTETVVYDATNGTFVVTADVTGATPLTTSLSVDNEGGGGAPEYSTGQVVRTAGNANDGVINLGGGQAITVEAGQTITLYGPTPADPREIQPQITLTLGATITEGVDTITIVEQAYTGQLNGGQLVNFRNGQGNVQFRSGSAAGFPSGETVKLSFDPTIDLGGGTTRTFVLSAVNNSLVFQIGANAGQQVRVGFGDLRANNLGFVGDTQPNGNARVVSQINITTLTGANEAIAIVDEAIRQVNTQRSALGAFTNRMEATIANLGVASENLTASESRIRDADIAFETTRFTRNQILVQAGTSILAQANTLPQNVLALLRG